MHHYKCDVCGKELMMDGIGYLGPKDRSDMTCNPWAEFEQLCIKCEEKNSNRKEL